ncbi:hypothetical protein CRG98_009000 [Punica granatum]|uniref:Uncharacterized protein n=1 Tax=Punica granatum TaxID=22663 RepID=A0A2I0KPS6_PUNGR|nr:hypothetical protein CRG98_009000 [Punica granatum]
MVFNESSKEVSSACDLPASGVPPQFEQEHHNFLQEALCVGPDSDFVNGSDLSDTLDSLSLMPHSEDRMSEPNPNPNPDADSSANRPIYVHPSSPPAVPEPAPELLHLSFNQDYGCFAVGTDRGFWIYNRDPFREIFRQGFG